MKKILLAVVILFGSFTASNAQGGKQAAPTDKQVVQKSKSAAKATPTATQNASAVKQPANAVKKTVTPGKPTPSATLNTNAVKQPAATKKVDKANTQANVVLKKDGTPDKRYKEAKKLKKDGTPDMRYKQNK